MQDRPAALRSSCLPPILSSTWAPIAPVAPLKNQFSDLLSSDLGVRSVGHAAHGDSDHVYQKS